MATLILLGLQPISTLVVGLLMARLLSRLTDAVRENTRIAIEAVDMAATTRAKVELGNGYVRDLHGERFGYAYRASAPEQPRQRQPSDSGLRATARSPSRPDPDELEPGRHSTIGRKGDT